LGTWDIKVVIIQLFEYMKTFFDNVLIRDAVVIHWAFERQQAEFEG